MRFDAGPQGAHRGLVYVRHPQHRMGVAHGNGPHPQLLPVHVEEVLVRRLPGEKRKGPRLEPRRPHVHRHLTVGLDPRDDDPGPGLHPNLALGGEALLPHVTGEAPGTVPALLHLAPVRVEDPVAEVRVVPRGGRHEQDLVAADPEAAIGEPPDLLRSEIQRTTCRVEHDEVVAEAVHLGKGKTHAAVRLAVRAGSRSARGLWRPTAAARSRKPVPPGFQLIIEYTYHVGGDDGKGVPALPAQGARDRRGDGDRPGRD